MYTPTYWAQILLFTITFAALSTFAPTHEHPNGIFHFFCITELVPLMHQRYEKPDGARHFFMVRDT